MKLDFSGQRVLVTGATRGIGQRIAADIEALGGEMILTGTDPRAVAELNAQAQEKGARRRWLCVDFLNDDSMRAFLNELEKLDRLDVCINNAGINRINFVDETKVEDWNAIIKVNLTTPYLIIRAVAPAMKRNRYGRIVNVSSIFGVVSREKRSSYTSSKFGLRGLTLSTANELARHNVLVNAVSPGFVDTELTRRILGKEEMAELTARIPAGRFAEVSDISNAAVMLASSLNTYIVGQNLVVDGGYVNL